jgi:hypothetical protein
MLKLASRSVRAIQFFMESLAKLSLVILGDIRLRV